MAYTSTTPALATLEFLGWHLDRRDINAPVMLIVATVPDTVSRQALKRTPKDWRNVPAPDSTRRIGDNWIHNGHSCLLFVPSVHLPRRAVTSEANVLINPAHVDFSHISVHRMSYVLDPRFT